MSLIRVRNTMITTIIHCSRESIMLGKRRYVFINTIVIIYWKCINYFVFIFIHCSASQCLKKLMFSVSNNLLLLLVDSLFEYFLLKICRWLSWCCRVRVNHFGHWWHLSVTLATKWSSACSLHKVTKFYISTIKVRMMQNHELLRNLAYHPSLHGKNQALSERRVQFKETFIKI